MGSTVWTEHFTATRHGRIRHAEAGTGEALVLLHATGTSAWQWNPVFESLARTRRLLAPDLPGHGDSGAPAARLSIREHALALLDWFAATGVTRPAIAGNSLGGCIALCLASEFAPHIREAVFVETPLRTDAQWAVHWPAAERYFSEVTTPPEVLQTRFRVVTPALLERWNVDRNKAGARQMLDAVLSIREYDAIGALGRLGVPAGAILGDRGPVRDGLPHWASVLPAERIIDIADAGHFPMIEQPDAFVAAMNRLLSI